MQSVMFTHVQWRLAPITSWTSNAITKLYLYHVRGFSFIRFRTEWLAQSHCAAAPRPGIEIVTSRSLVRRSTSLALPRHHTQRERYMYDTIRYDTRSCSNVRSKAGISHLNLQHGTKLKKLEKKKK